MNHRLEIFSSVLEAQGIHKSYFLFSNFRAGSTLLGQLLKQQTELGFHLESFNAITTLYKTQDDALFDALKKLLRPVIGGAFATKMMWTQRNHLCNFLGIDASVPGVFFDLFPGPCFISLTRRDKIAQAISYYIAAYSGLWDSSQSRNFDQASIPYSFHAIHYYYQHFLGFDDLMARFLQPHQDAGITLYYEDLAQDPRTALQQSLQQLGLEYHEQKWPNELPLQKLAGDLSSRFHEQFMHDINRYAPDKFLPGRLVGPQYF